MVFSRPFVVLLKLYWRKPFYVLLGYTFFFFSRIFIYLFSLRLILLTFLSKCFGWFFLCVCLAVRLFFILQNRLIYERAWGSLEEKITEQNNAGKNIIRDMHTHGCTTSIWFGHTSIWFIMLLHVVHYSQPLGRFYFARGTYGVS